jgi:hypothetical protein
LGKSGRATFLAKLAPGTEYLLTVGVYTVADANMLDSLQVMVGHTLLKRAGQGERDGYLELHWLIERQIVMNLSGEIEVVFSVGAAAREGAIAFSRLICHPW